MRRSVKSFTGEDLRSELDQLREAQRAAEQDLADRAVSRHNAVSARIAALEEEDLLLHGLLEDLRPE